MSSTFYCTCIALLLEFILSTGSLRQVLFSRSSANHLYELDITHLLYELKRTGLFDSQQGLDFIIRDLAVL